MYNNRRAEYISRSAREIVYILAEELPPEPESLPEFSPEFPSESFPEFPPEPLEDLPNEFQVKQEYFNNNDIVGHLWIEGTAINYLVLQSTDNEFYLYHDIHKNPSSAGWIFLDYYVNLSYPNQNTVIYGHNMRSGIMFHNIRYFANYYFLRNHSIINLNTVYGSTKWQVFAFYTAHISFPYTHINFENEAQWAFMLERFIEASIHDTGITPASDDRILTLSTCVSNGDRDMRYVLQAKLIKNGGS